MNDFYSNSKPKESIQNEANIQVMDFNNDISELSREADISNFSKTIENLSETEGDDSMNQD